MGSDRFDYSPRESIHFRISGCGPRHLLLLHGFGASLRTWDDLLPFFSPHEYTLHLLDLKGHGSSSKNTRGDFSARHNARIVIAYIRSCISGPVSVIGHSFGGTVSLLVALELPRLERLILIGAPLFPQKIPPFMRILGIPFIGPLLMTLVPARKIARRGLEQAFHRHERISGRHLQRYIECYRGPASARALSRTVRQLVPADIDRIIENIEEIKIPTFLLWGERDRIVNPRHGERLQALLKNSRLVVIPDCGHNPHEERPQETFNLIRDFLHDVIK